MLSTEYFHHVIRLISFELFICCVFVAVVCLKSTLLQFEFYFFLQFGRSYSKIMLLLEQLDVFVEKFL